MYDQILGCWTSVDPMAEKYYHISPYVFCLDNPVRMVDRDGKDPWDFFPTADAAAIDFGYFYNDNSIREGSIETHPINMDKLLYYFQKMLRLNPKTYE